MTVNLSVF